MVHTELPEESVHGQELLEMEKTTFLGGVIDHDIVKGVAEGDLDPISYEPFGVQESELRIM